MSEGPGLSGAVLRRLILDMDVGVDGTRGHVEGMGVGRLVVQVGVTDVAVAVTAVHRTALTSLRAVTIDPS